VTGINKADFLVKKLSPSVDGLDDSDVTILGPGGCRRGCGAQAMTCLTSPKFLVKRGFSESP
jgi:hypothetical protein